MKILISLLSVLLLLGCSTEPDPINFGTDACSFCQMTIVDRQHAAQIVTVKGKSYKYDAIECMVNDLKKWNRPEVAHFLVADYANPGELTDATTAHYLISEKIPSPMGEFLSAFENEDQRMPGKHYGWDELKQRLENQ